MDERRPGMIRGKSIHAMTTEELEELLRAEENTEQEPNVERIREILAVLDARTEAPEADVDAAWDDFKTNYLFGEALNPGSNEERTQPEPMPKHSRKRPVRRAALIAAVIAVLALASTGSAFGFNLWESIANWSAETLGLEFRKTVKTPSEMNPELHDLAVAVANADRNTLIMPRYLPEGYHQTAFYSDDASIAAQYEKDGSSIIIQLFKIRGARGDYFSRDIEASEKYVVHGIEHMISTNMNSYLAVWANGDWECSIMGVQSEEELFRMIDSIYSEER